MHNTIEWMIVGETWVSDDFARITFQYLGNYINFKGNFKHKAFAHVIYHMNKDTGKVKFHQFDGGIPTDQATFLPVPDYELAEKAYAEFMKEHKIVKVGVHEVYL